MLEVIGWIGSILFAMCGIPQAWSCCKTGNADGISWPFLLMWLFGEIFTIIYIIPTHQYPLLLNYICNLTCLLIIIGVKMWPNNLKLK